MLLGAKLSMFSSKSQKFSVDLNNQWRDLETWTNNEKGFVVYESFASKGIDSAMDKMFITVKGLKTFTIWITSYAESTYDYTVAFKADYIPASNSGWSSVGGDVMGTTYGLSYDPTGGINETRWKKVVYSLDGGEHTICVVYRKDGSGHYNHDRGYVAIPLKQ